MMLDQCPLPIVLAPLAGGPSTPELCAAVCEAGGLGFLGAGYLSAADLGTRIEQTRRLTRRPFGVNVFVPGRPGQMTDVEAYAQRLAGEAERAGVALGEPRPDDDDWGAKLDLLSGAGVEVLSFTFGCPSPETVARMQRAGAEVWVTVTSPDEAQQAESAGADCLVVQGAEAGGHRGGFVDGDEAIGLLSLLQLVNATTSVPLVATGGIMTGVGLAAALAAGARVGALGSAFLLSPEAGTSDVHRQAIARGDRPTALTRAFTGRLARGISNRFLEDHGHEAPSAYPQVHHLTAPLRGHGRSTGDGDLVNLWAGQAYALAAERPAAEITQQIAADARTALEHVSRSPS